MLRERDAAVQKAARLERQALQYSFAYSELLAKGTGPTEEEKKQQEHKLAQLGCDVANAKLALENSLVS